MSRKPVLSRERVDRDIEEAIEHYLAEASPEIALGFIGALNATYRLISRHPASGPPRHAHELGLPGLRCAPVRGYPYLVFYAERDDRVDVWRVLHGERHIPAWMREPPLT